MIIKQGMVVLHDEKLQLLVQNPRYRIPLVTQMPVEIRMGSCWIEGVLNINANIENDCTFYCKGSMSFCGIREGMQMRILEDEQ